MSVRRKRGFTLIELITVLVIMAIIALIVTPLVMSIIRKAKIAADKRSVDAYGRSIELAIALYLLDTGTFPTDLHSLTIEYSGNEVVCNVMNMKQNGGLYMSQCSVNGIEVKDSKEEDGWYHYGVRDLTNVEIIDMYVNALEEALKEYHDEYNEYPSDYKTLTLNYDGEDVDCNINFNYDGSFYINGCSVSGINVDYVYGVDKSTAVKAVLANKNDISTTNYISGNIHEMYTFEHEETVQTPTLTDYRYIGSDPYNYVEFNNGETWRIIGVFTVEDENGNKEQRVKIVRNEKFSSNMAWDSVYPYDNEWSIATLNIYLNGEYLNGLDEASQSMIINTKYYLGASAISDDLKGEDYYKSERGTNVYSGRSKSFIGKIALMYPSDYIYTYAFGVDNACYINGKKCNESSGKTNGWIYNTNGNSCQWLLSPYVNDSHFAFLLSSSGNFISNGVAYSCSFHPTIYLSSFVKIISGTGKIDDPYKLSL